MSEAELREPIKRKFEKLGLSSENVVPLEKKEDDKPDAHSCYDHTGSGSSSPGDYRARSSYWAMRQAK